MQKIIKRIAMLEIKVRKTLQIDFDYLRFLTIRILLGLGGVGVRGYARGRFAQTSRQALMDIQYSMNIQHNMNIQF